LIITSNYEESTLFLSILLIISMTIRKNT